MTGEYKPDWFFVVAGACPFLALAVMALYGATELIESLF